MIGICRGAQFLNVMAGGTLWQHVNHHSGVHPLTVYDRDGRLVGSGKVNSVHHQQMRPGPGGVILGMARESTLRVDASGAEQAADKFDDVEIVWYPEKNFYCFQGHPEFGHAETTALFFRQLEELYI
jgi:gamma-glutamyl-gamma-aminobutyrate hydrolase PuuD